MLTFKKLLEELTLLESKHMATSHDSSEEEIHSVLGNEKISASKADGDLLKTGYAIKHMHPEKHPKIFDTHIRNMANHSAAYVRATVAAHPHTPKDVLEKLANDSKERVSRTAKATLSGGGKAPEAAPKAEKPAAPAKKKIPASKPEAKPETKKEEGYGVESIKPEDSDNFPGATQVTHIKHNGKVVGAAVSSRHSAENENWSNVRHTSYMGSPNKGFKPVANHEGHAEALKSVVRRHMGK